MNFNWSLSESFGSTDKSLGIYADPKSGLRFEFGYYGGFRDGDIVPVSRTKAKELVTMLSKYLELTKGLKDPNENAVPYNVLLDNCSGL